MVVFLDKGDLVRTVAGAVAAKAGGGSSFDWMAFMQLPQVKTVSERLINRVLPAPQPNMDQGQQMDVNRPQPMTQPQAPVTTMNDYLDFIDGILTNLKDEMTVKELRVWFKEFRGQLGVLPRVKA